MYRASPGWAIRRFIASSTRSARVSITPCSPLRMRVASSVVAEPRYVRLDHGGGYAECSDRINEVEFRGNTMLAMIDTSTETLLCELLATCMDTNHIASELAAQSRDEPLRQLLEDRAASYRGAVRTAARERRDRRAGRHGASLSIDHEAELADIESVWEAVECSALICFRDALDAELPADLQTAVRGWIEEGVSALERLRSLPAG